MSDSEIREAVIVEGTELVNVIVIPDGDEGDDLLSETCIEVTGLDPMPGIGIGWTYVEGVFVPPPVAWTSIRARRDGLLADSDWTQMVDSPLADGPKQEWADYRQALRDVPQDFATPDDVVWPEAP